MNAFRTNVDSGSPGFSWGCFPVRAIRIVIAIGLLTAANAQAATNSWAYAGSDYWDIDTRWSLNLPPSTNQDAIYIINNTSKTVVIDNIDTTSFPSTLTISNLTVGGTAPTINTLYLSNMNAGAVLPLHVLNGLAITNGGVLQITNSLLRVDGVAGGALQVAGKLQLDNKADIVVRSATFATAAVVQFGLGSNSLPVVVSSNLTLAGTLNISDAGGLAPGVYPLFTYGGALTNNGLTIGTGPNPSFTYVVNTATQGQVTVVVSTNGAAPPDPFIAWQNAYFPGGTNNPNAAPNADPLGKGISNTNQFLMGLNPTNSASTFAVISIARTGNNMVVTWKTSGGSSYSPGPKTNVLEYTAGKAGGSYTNSFISTGVTNILSTLGDTITNATDVGGATNTPARFYRARVLAP